MSTELRTLHVAALPFPSSQGTQALLHAMLSAQHEAGRAVELLCYAHGASPHVGAYPVARAPHVPGLARSLRSGPSPSKVLLDVSLARALRRRVRTFRPHVVLAHHVEAACAALLVCDVPVVYVAHTSLAEELPVYLPRVAGSPARWAGAALERSLCRHAARTLAVSPLLAAMLERESALPVLPLRLPWTVPQAITPEERESARRRLGLGGQRVLLYAGNLDAYQGLEVCAEALSELAQRHSFTWLVATEGARSELAALLRDPRLAACTRMVSLAGERARREAHAAADAVLVPRRSAGGVPIKLLDALARGLRVVTSPRACAGTELAGFCRLARDDDAHSWHAQLEALLAEPADPGAGERARSYLLREHSAASFVAALDRQLAGLGAWPRA